MSIRIIPIFIFLFFIVTSCLIQITGFTSNYKNVKLGSPQLIKKIHPDHLICEAAYSDSCKVVLVNGKQLKSCIQEKDRVILYIWDGNCSSSYCYGLDRVQAYLNEKGIALYVVAEYYDQQLLNAFYNLQYPIFGIDTEYYNTNLIGKYVKKFLADLSIKKQDSNRMIYLEKGKFVKTFQILEKIQ